MTKGNTVPEDEADLLFTSAHEVFPGHFVQGMHQRASGSRVLQTFETYTASEGWAHYVEEMMWDQGLGDRDPRMHIGQLKNALLRDVRFLVALGYHAGTMTVEDATKLFVEQAFADRQDRVAAGDARHGRSDVPRLHARQAIIMELRRDWQRQNPRQSHCASSTTRSCATARRRCRSPAARCRRAGPVL